MASFGAAAGRLDAADDAQGEEGADLDNQDELVHDRSRPPKGLSFFPLQSNLPLSSLHGILFQPRICLIA
jgi:hypothetical protein